MTLVVRQSLILGLATFEKPLTVAIAKTGGNTDPHLKL